MSSLDAPPAKETAPAAPVRPVRRLVGFPRRHKVLSILVALLLVGGGFYVIAHMVASSYVNSQLSQIPRFEPSIQPQGRPIRVQDTEQNILLVGVDAGGQTIQQALAEPQWPSGEFRSDAIMMLHIPANRKSASLVSIPRDSYVPIRGYGTTKINAAFSYGGPGLLINTVEDLTGVYIDHVAVIDFGGFQSLTDYLDGVNIYIPETVTDTHRHYTWTQGWHHLDGEHALWYVRQRYGLARSDFDREQRQQNFLRAIVDRILHRGEISNPVKSVKLVRHLKTFISVDKGLTDDDMINLITTTKHIDLGDITVATVPYTGTPTIDGASVVTLDTAGVKDMFKAVVHDDLPRWISHHHVDTLPDPSSVT